PAAPGARFAASQHPRPSYGQATHMGRALRDDRHRYVEWRELATGALAARELYDHAADPAETRNLAAEPALAPVVAAFAAELAARATPIP
ncbi:MAG: iduronate sulfatase, partial [Verrucomicrobiota bacterium]